MSYGCFNRADYKANVTMQAGWNAAMTDLNTKRESRYPIMVKVPFRMSPRCEYTATSELGQADPKCIGCSRRAPALDDPK